MNILIVGSDTPGALERYCAAALQSLGHAVAYHDTHTRIAVRSRFRQTPLLSEAEFALHRRRFNQSLLDRVQAEHPDLVLVFKGVELFAGTLDRLRGLLGRPLLANWNPDSPFDYATANTNRDIVDAVPHYDVYFIWDRDLVDPLREAGSPCPAYLPFAYDPAHHFPTEPDSELASEVCFVGGYTPRRADLLARLAREGIDVGLWGTNWHRLDPQSPLTVRGGWTSGVAMSRIFSSAHIVLNVIRPQNGQAHNMRTFAAPATRALMLSTRTRDQVAWLPEGAAAAYYETPEEMLAQVRHYLRDGAARAAAAAGGHRRITAGGHTYLDRMRTLLEVVTG
ncbi:MAG: glycosyltransferase [Anaerolineae bacterium]